MTLPHEQKRGFTYVGRCVACGSPTRPLFVTGKGKNARRQRPKWWTCDNRHQQVRKSGQI